mmetsp:Transcript_4770/g.7248  ORF Transcript_4770/g.7248 Transcript_4770/m.7248 type:complete len:89 (-) Transcript_4770:230-496(-)
MIGTNLTTEIIIFCAFGSLLCCIVYHFFRSTRYQHSGHSRVSPLLFRGTPTSAVQNSNRINSPHSAVDVRDDFDGCYDIVQVQSYDDS